MFSKSDIRVYYYTQRYIVSGQRYQPIITHRYYYFQSESIITPRDTLFMGQRYKPIIKLRDMLIQNKDNSLLLHTQILLFPVRAYYTQRYKCIITHIDILLWVGDISLLIHT